MTLRAPGDELRDLQSQKVIDKLFDDEIVRDAEIGCGETEFGKGEVDAVHPKGDLVLEFSEIGLLQRWTVADDEGAFAFVNIFKRGKAFDALAPPGRA